VSSALLTSREYEVTATFPQERKAERPSEPSQPASASAAIATIHPRAYTPTAAITTASAADVLTTVVGGHVIQNPDPAALLAGALHELETEPA